MNAKKNVLHFMFISLPFFFLFVKMDQHELKVGAMVLQYEVEQDSLWLRLKAPTEGWIAIGFNDRNNIVGCDLLMFNVRDGLVHYEDQFVQGPQLHPADWELEASSSIRMIAGTETQGWTIATFKIPLHSNDEYDFYHQAGKDFWLIMAYSLHDDFNHHSIMRKHQKYAWKMDKQKP